MSLLDIYFLSNWLPTVLNDLGASVSSAAAIGSMLQVGGVVGTFALGSIIDRFSFRALALVYFIAVFAVGAIGQLGHSDCLRHHGDLRRRVLHRRRPDRRQRAGGGVLSDVGQGHRRRLGARDRPGRLDRRAAGRRRAADHEMEHGVGLHGGRGRRSVRGAGGIFPEPARWRRWRGSCIGAAARSTSESRRQAARRDDHELVRAASIAITHDEP